MNIAEIREKYPQYKDVPDEKLASGLYKKYYAEKMPENEFYQKIGYSPEAAAPPPSLTDNLLSTVRGNIPSVAKEAAKLPGNLLTGVAQGTYDLGNLIPGFNKVVPQPQSVNEMIGLGAPTGNDRTIQQAASFIPSLVGSEVAVPAKLIQGGATLGARLLGEGAKQAAQGAFYEQSIGGNPILGAALGLAPVAGHGAAQVASNAIDNYVKEPFKAAVLKDITPRVFQKEFGTSEAPQSIMQGTENLLRKRHDIKMGEFEKLSDSAGKIATKIDDSVKPGSDLASQNKAFFVGTKPSFDNANYIDSLKKLKASKDPLNDSAEINTINHLIENAPKGFGEAIAARKYINREIPLHLQVGKVARASLIEAVDNNIKNSKNPLVSEFADLWRSSNKKYAKEVVPFYEVPNKFDVDKIPKDLKASYQQGGNTEGNIINLYNPTGSRVDTLGSKHLKKLLGNDEDAVREAIRAAHFKDSFVPADNGFVPKSLFLTKYEKLSPSQKNVMFKPEEQELLDVLSRQKNLSNIENVAAGKGIKDKITGGLVGGAIGETLAHMLGLPPGIAGWAGGAAGAALGRNYWEKLTAGKVNRESFLKLNKEVKELNKGAEEVKKNPSNILSKLFPEKPVNSQINPADQEYGQAQRELKAALKTKASQSKVFIDKLANSLEKKGVHREAPIKSLESETKKLINEKSGVVADLHDVARTPIVSVNPTGGILVDYTPQARMAAPLGENMTTLAASMNKDPETLITVYRGAPKTQKDINPGDFISTDKNSALSYAENGNVISKKVRLGDILDDMDDPLGGDYLYRPGAFDEIGSKVRDVTKSKWYNNYLNYLNANPTKFKNLDEWINGMKASGKTKSQLTDIWNKSEINKK